MKTSILTLQTIFLLLLVIAFVGLQVFLLFNTCSTNCDKQIKNSEGQRMLSKLKVKVKQEQNKRFNKTCSLLNKSCDYPFECNGFLCVCPGIST